ncbi:TPA: hypothetical protein I7C74_003364 [Vibrio cholerae]|nr:hypothetical protein [Vibrio cholerae]HAT7601953.1 hypothetical protein [Vibrio cholerae O1]HAS4975669.1 hypothetical protein [Vibrio cholerae]HAS4987166.1 hypothetical protein [Vibrio cholerae]HAS4991013.1 hypothetical protein [Vibrio cholerae]
MKTSLIISVVFFLILLFVTAILVLFPDAALQLVGDDINKRMLEEATIKRLSPKD